MTKDRLRDFQSAVNESESLNMPDSSAAFADRPVAYVVNGSSSGGVANVVEVDADNALDEFFDDVTRVRQTIDSVQRLVQEVKLKHSAVLASPTEDADIKRQLEQLMISIKDQATRARNKLKDLEAETDRLSESKEIDSSADLRIRHTQCNTISRKLTEVMNDYNKAQVDYREACKARIKRQLNLVSVDKTDEELEEILETGNSAIFAQGIMTDTQQAKAMLSDIEARHRDIVQLERSIKELHDMFVDMAMLVETQGEMIDSIEYNVEKAKEYVEAGQDNLVSAVQHQSGARQKRVCLIAFGIAVAVAAAVSIALAILLTLPK